MCTMKQVQSKELFFHFKMLLPFIRMKFPSKQTSAFLSKWLQTRRVTFLTCKIKSLAHSPILLRSEILFLGNICNEQVHTYSLLQKRSNLKINIQGLLRTAG